jgi:heme-degrading monooxygenase HmoA
MIARVWRGWATPPNAAAYEEHFRGEVLAHLGQVTGFVTAQLLRRDDADEIELMTVTYFESIEAITGFAGADYETAVVAPEARRVLSRFEERVRHYEVRSS